MGSQRFKGLVLAVLCLATVVSLASADDEPVQAPPGAEEVQGPPAPPVIHGPPVPELVQGPPRPDADPDKVPFGPADKALDPVAMAARVDAYIAKTWADKKVQPAPVADDAEFFRRLSLDINGRIPTITQLTDFLDDNRPDKRRLWVEELMQGRDNAELYVNHYTTFWRKLFFSQPNMQAQFTGFQMENWVRDQVKKNAPYDKMVHELLTTQSNQYYQANENKPESVAGNSARLFLGVKLECAQCHDDRSGGSWTRVQFWQYAAFFANRGAGPARIAIPDSKKTVEARFLDGTSPVWKSGASSQNLVTDWITSANNEYFAKAIVNRMWHYFLGVGFVDPVDAASEENPASHPELLDELARQFVANKFDMKWLIRTITATKAYQLTSVRTHESQDNPRLFARMNVRGMTAEQLYDSIIEATGIKDNSPRVDPRFNQFNQFNSPRSEFIAKFNNVHDKSTETKTSILQALFLMNGGMTANATSLEKCKTLETVANAAPSVTTQRRIQELFIVTLSRKPTGEEMDEYVKYVESGGPGKDPKKALADIFWVLLNCGEFKQNH